MINPQKENAMSKCRNSMRIKVQLKQITWENTRTENVALAFSWNNEHYWLDIASHRWSDLNLREKNHF